MTVSRRLVLVLSASVAAIVAILATSSGGAGAASPPANQRVIVVFKDQEANTPATKNGLAARQSAEASDRQPVVSQMTSSGATNLQAYTLVNAESATVSSTEAAQLAANPAVSEVVPDRPITLGAPSAPFTAASNTVTPPTGTNPQACTTAAAGQIPEALSLIGADSDSSSQTTARSLGFDGSGVTVGFIADGLDINNPDLIRKSNGANVVTDYKDFTGFGTSAPTAGAEAFGDASAIAAQGNTVYSTHGFGPDAASCNVRVEGVAPGANLVALSVFGPEDDAGYTSSFLQAIDYAVDTDRVNVLNESFGGNDYPDDPGDLDVIKMADDAAVAAGTTVTVSSGDAGPTNTIGTPASDPNVISAGASTAFRTYLQTGYGGANFPGVTGWGSNQITPLSSSGYTQQGRLIDVVAPGDSDWALCSKDVAEYSECTNYFGTGTPIQPFGGTSEAAPLTAGVAALVDQAYQKTHGSFPTPAVVKQIIDSTATDLGAPGAEQGAGILNAAAAVQAAESYQETTATGDTLLKSASQLDATDAPNTSETLTDTLTNNGSTTQNLSLSTRVIGTPTVVDSETVRLADKTSSQILDYEGRESNYQAVTFTVPAGQAQLATSIAYPGTNSSGADPRVRVTLLDPSGKLVAHSRPQGVGNYGYADVINPAPGTWTAYVWSLTGANGGATGNMPFQATVAPYKTLGTVSPKTLTLAPGQSAPVTVTEKTPAVPGDLSGSVVITDSSQTISTTIPFALRSVIPAGSQTFVDHVTGGNGRDINTGQTFYYDVNVPAGAKELNANVSLASNPNNPFQAYLISPSGEPLAYQSNQFLNTTGLTSQLGVQLHALAPVQGTWTLIVLFAPAVSGTAISRAFRVTTSDTALTAASSGLPTSKTNVLTPGQPYSFRVAITNTGTSNDEYFVDGRLPGSQTYTLSSLTTSTLNVPADFNTNVPQYLIPTNTSSFSAAATTTGSTPIQFDADSPTGDPDVTSNSGSSVSLTFNDSPIGQGQWGVFPTVAGAFGATGPASEPVTASMTATTAPFDPALSSPLGDLWEASTDPSVLDSFAPRTAKPGQVATLPVTITPPANATPGSTVTGTLYIDDTSNVVYQQFLSYNGDQLVALPYSYKVGTTAGPAKNPAPPGPAR